MIFLLSEFHLNHIFNGKNIFIKTHYFSEYMQISKLIMKKIGNKTINIYRQNPVLNGYHIESELEDVLQSSYYKSPLGYINVDWLVDEVIHLENKMNFYFKKNKKRYHSDRRK